jgi:hypothetical protein
MLKRKSLEMVAPDKKEIPSQRLQIGYLTELELNSILRLLCQAI